MCALPRKFSQESTGEFSLEGCIELSWICGLIRPHSVTGVKGFDPRQFYVGWVDAATGEAVADDEIKKRYEKTILEHSEELPQGVSIAAIQAPLLVEVEPSGGVLLTIGNEGLADEVRAIAQAFMQG